MNREKMYKKNIVKKKTSGKEDLTFKVLPFLNSLDTDKTNNNIKSYILYRTTSSTSYL